MTKILLIEDEASQREVLTMFLSFEGYEVKAISNASQVLENIVEFQPEIVVTDIALPDVDGFALIVNIHKNFPDIKILAYSAYATEDKFEDFHTNVIKLGAKDFLAKPYDLEVLLKRLRSL